MTLTSQQKAQGKWQRSFTREKASRCSWLTNNDKRLLNAIFDRRHMRHKKECGTECEPGWAKVPKKELKRMTNLGQEKLDETVGRLLHRGVIERETEGRHAGRDGATRYRIINMPPYDPGPTSPAAETPQAESTAVDKE
jgi:hypothetical protein